MRHLTYFIIVISLFILSIHQSSARQISSNSGSQNWSQTTAWQGGTVPGDQDTVIIIAGSIMTVDIDTICERLLLQGGVFAGTRVIIGAGNTLEVQGGVLINSNGEPDAFVVDIRLNGVLSVTGSPAGNLSIDQSIGKLDMSQGSGTLNLSGSLSVSNGGQVLSSSTSTVNYNGSSPQTITIASGITYNHLQINNTSGSGAVLGGNINTSNVGGNVNVQSGRLRNGNRTMVGNTGMDFQVLAGATFEFEGTSNWSSISGFTTSLAVNSTIEFGGGAQSIGPPNDEQSYSDLVISGIGTKTLTANLSVIDLTIVSGNLDVDATSNYNVALTGNWNKTGGNFTPRAGTVRFDGSDAQTISGTQTFTNLRINNSHATADVTVSAGSTTIDSTLTIVDGNFNANGLTTLAADADWTARIGVIPTGSQVKGNLVFQQYAGSRTKNGWLFLGSPIRTSIEEAWDDHFVTSGFTGTDAPTFNFKSVYYYYEPTTGLRNQGYFNPGSTSDPLASTDSTYIYGFQIYTDNAEFPVTLTYTGEVVQGTQAWALSHTNGGTGDDNNDGWHQIANPYPSAIDWDDVSRTANVGATYYVYDDEGDQYLSYTAGVGGTAPDRIAACQSFWVKCDNGAGTITFDEVDKSATNPSIIRQNLKALFEGEFLTLHLEGNGYNKETTISLNNNATFDFDTKYDAYQLGSFSTKHPYFATVSNDSKNVALNSIPDFDNDVTIPVLLTVGTSGSYTISVKDFSTFPESACITLEDTYENKSVNLRDTASYSFSIQDTVTQARFMLHISAPVSKEIKDVTCQGKADGHIIVKGKGSGPWDYTWKDADGKVVKTSAALNTGDTLSALSGGTYSVMVTNNGSCGDVEEIMQVIEPAEVMANFTLEADTVYLGNGGVINLINNSSGSDQYSWDFGDTTGTSSNAAPTYTYASEGTYLITLIASNGNCSDTTTRSVTVVNDLGTTEGEKLSEQFNHYVNNDRLILEFDFEQEKNVSISIYNLAGQQVIEPQRSKFKNDRKSIDLTTLENGFYIVNIDNGTEIFSGRFNYLK